MKSVNALEERPLALMRVEKALRPRFAVSLHHFLGPEGEPNKSNSPGKVSDCLPQSAEESATALLLSIVRIKQR